MEFGKSDIVLYLHDNSQYKKSLTNEESKGTMLSVVGFQSTCDIYINGLTIHFAGLTIPTQMRETLDVIHSC
jgi:hypothetical protein